ncbi:hypothetical protein ACROYT_G043934 [Oculina patagonica]
MAEAEPLAQRPIDVRPQEALNEARREVPIQNAPAVVPVQIPPPAVVPAAAPPVQNPGAQVVAPPLEAQANLNVQALEERLKKLEGKTETDSVELALQALHRTLDKSRFDPEDAVMDLESLVKVAKINNHAKAREYECVLDEVQKHSKSLNQKSLRDLLVALVGDPIKSKVLEKTHKLLKHTTPENRSTSFPSWRRYNNRFTYHQGGSRDNRGRGGFQASRSASPFANRRLRSSPCYFCGSTEHFIKDCAEFQDMKSARARNKSA